ncbi:MAG: S9 family peptidase [Ignavibacteriae bacterium]|nr:S9 family peptidase [Ignavibacteriota bacterium]
MFKNITIIFVIALIAISCSKEKINYPETKKGSVVDNYFGTEVADPYRWLEDDKSDETATWVKEQNKVTNSYLINIPFREKIKNRLTELWNYEKYSAPYKVGEYYVFSKNNGLQEQSVVYIQKGLSSEPTVFIDPNTFSDDGTVSLANYSFSNDNKYISYSISKGGSDWREVFVMEVETRTKLDDHLKWVKFSGLSWYKDGFYYSRYDEPKKDAAMKAKNEFQKLYYHKLGTNQSEDKIIFEDKKNPQRGFGAFVTDDEKFLIISGWEGSSNTNTLYYKNLQTGSKITPIIPKFEFEYNVIDNIDGKFLTVTNDNAPNNKIILIDPTKPKSEWKEIISESENVLRSSSLVGNKIINTYLIDANSNVKIFNTNGNHLYDVELPGVGTVSGFGGKKKDVELFYSYSSFTVPSTIYKYDVAKNESELFRKSNVKFSVDEFETKQVFYKSKDGTEVPMFITYKKGLELNGDNPTLLYAYGGFNIAMLPRFRLTIIPILENGGVFAMACLRGGSEYGEEWHKAGMLEKKQNVFDDFISAGEYLIENKYTSSQKLALQGGSNGGLLMGAVINQRPDLCKVAFPMVGVMDMLRFHKFTIGWAWVPEYGSSDDSTQFDFLYKYSPIHNIDKNISYPATMTTTADHDDRVFPAHSFKYVATLQEKYSGENPQLIRIETKAGHGAGTSTTKTIELYSDLWSFMFYNMGLDAY